MRAQRLAFIEAQLDRTEREQRFGVLPLFSGEAAPAEGEANAEQRAAWARRDAEQRERKFEESL